jgi:hypothetical protein
VDEGLSAALEHEEPAAVEILEAGVLQTAWINGF